MSIGGFIERRFGPKYSMALGCILQSGGIALSYFFCNNYWPFALVYGFISGCGIGIAYSSPMAVCMKWLPNHKGLVNGLITAGYGMGAFIFNQVQLKLINPNNEPPAESPYYSAEQVKDFPKVVLYLGAIYFSVQLIGWLLVSQPPKDYIPPVNKTNINKKKNTSYYKPSEALKSFSFYILWTMFACAGVAVQITSSYWKVYFIFII